MENNQYLTILQGFKEIVDALLNYNRVVADYQMTVTTAIAQFHGEVVKMNHQIDRIITERPGMPL